MVKEETKNKGKVEPIGSVRKVIIRDEMGGENSPDHWILDDVSYRGKDYTVIVGGEYHESKLCNLRDQELALEQSLDAKNKGIWHTPNLPLLYSSFRTLYENGGNRAKEARDSINRVFAGKDLMTLTRIKPTSNEYKVIHNVDTPNQYANMMDIQGASGTIGKCLDSRSLEALFGTSDVDEVDAVFEWMTGRKPLFRADTNIDGSLGGPVLLNLPPEGQERNPVIFSPSDEVGPPVGCCLGLYNYTKGSGEEKLFNGFINVIIRGLRSPGMFGAVSPFQPPYDFKVTIGDEEEYVDTRKE